MDGGDYCNNSSITEPLQLSRGLLDTGQSVRGFNKSVPNRWTRTDFLCLPSIIVFPRFHSSGERPCLRVKTGGFSLRYLLPASGTDNAPADQAGRKQKPRKPASRPWA
ncbi:non-ribosomal peptide synthetase-like protein [Anopheles sinensis]|uniref:Non-ribosomal peptide synthetase-like protein n=1 Tax=Anopheles sinensis TaxID=74873 RepID=A0A084W961_ANOSI|nr:non-ribosomal peptide synthetase-like protein [Anopheles sinensis]